MTAIAIACAALAGHPGSASAQLTDAPPVSEAPVSVVECVPHCRVGYVCIEGQCVSACNPPCPSGTRCTEALQCEGPTVELQRAAFERESAVERATEYRHDGFYLRFGITLGYAFDTIERRGQQLDSSGAGGLVHYAIGATVAEGLVLALTHRTLGVFSPSTDIEGLDLADDHYAVYQLFGGLLDFYPDPARGFHVGLQLGFGSADIVLDLIDDEFEESDEFSGYSIGLSAGYDLWIGKQWSLGVSLELSYLDGAEDNVGEHRVFLPLIAISALYH